MLRFAYLLEGLLFNYSPNCLDADTTLLYSPHMAYLIPTNPSAPLPFANRFHLHDAKYGNTRDDLAEFVAAGDFTPLPDDYSTSEIILAGPYLCPARRQDDDTYEWLPLPRTFHAPPGCYVRPDAIPTGNCSGYRLNFKTPGGEIAHCVSLGHLWAAAGLFVGNQAIYDLPPVGGFLKLSGAYDGFAVCPLGAPAVQSLKLPRPRLGRVAIRVRSDNWVKLPALGDGRGGCWAYHPHLVSAVLGQHFNANDVPPRPVAGRPRIDDHA